MLLLWKFLFVMTGSFWALAVSIVLLLVSGIWNEFFQGMGRKRARFVLVVRKALFSLAALTVSVLWVINLYAQPIVKSIELPADRKSEIDPAKLDPPAVMLKNIETMNAFGSRTTGSEGHNQFIAWLEQQVADMGLTINRDNYTFDRWEEKKSSIIIDNQEIHVSLWRNRCKRSGGRAGVYQTRGLRQSQRQNCRGGSEKPEAFSYWSGDERTESFSRTE
ncbi:hypothetical protein [Paenibacillus riograndensis]|uniref:hypothetical protein n=1 Tax=Paenibacillus riograndensis TaxID=483937 RepID=UPI0012FD011D|nr:hypothetical protein [Paenibacillus riograndensis]